MTLRILSRFAGPQDGVCTINVRQMWVNKPRNAHDEDIMDGQPFPELAITMPSSLSYYFQKLRLGELCYQLNESLTTNPTKAMTLNEIMEIDAKFGDFIHGVPEFFKLQDANEGELSEDDAQKDPAIIVQSYCLNSLFQTIRCKLHLPSLARSAVDSQYSQSRKICLDAARKIVAAERRLEESELPFALTRFRVGGVLYTLFVAIIALLLDICFNKDETNRASQKIEVVQAFKKLEEAKRQTNFAGKLLDCLMIVIRKHQVSLPVDGQQAFPEEIDTPALETASKGKEDSNSTPKTLVEPELPYLDEIWQTFDSGLDMDMLDMDTIFLELESYT